MFRVIKGFAEDLRDEASSTKRHLMPSSRSSNNISSHTHPSKSTSSLSVLSRRNGINSRTKKNEEVDGNSEEDTVVHRELVDFYKEKGMQLPDFLLSSSHPAANDIRNTKIDHQQRLGHNKAYNEDKGMRNEQAYVSQRNEQAYAPLNTTNLPVQRNPATQGNGSSISNGQRDIGSHSLASLRKNGSKSSTVQPSAKTTPAARPSAPLSYAQQNATSIPQRSYSSYQQAPKPAGTPPQQNRSTFESLSPETSIGNTSPGAANTTRRFRRKHI